MGPAETEKGGKEREREKGRGNEKWSYRAAWEVLGC